MKPEDFSRPARLDEHIEALSSELERRQQAQQGLADAPDLRLTLDIHRAYQAETDEDQRSLERVLTRLVGNDASDQPKVIFLPQASKTQKRMSAMQNNTMTSLPEPKAQGKWTKRLGLIAAVLCVALLVGGFLTALNATHLKPKTTTASPKVTQVPTATPTPTIKTGPRGTVAWQGVTATNPSSWSPAGNRLVGTDANGMPASWDGLTGGNIVEYHLPSSLSSNNGPGYAIWSSDGSRVAFSEGKGIAVFNAKTGTLLQSLTMPQVSSTAQNAQAQGFGRLAWSPDGKELATIYYLTTGQNARNSTTVIQLYVWNLMTNQTVTKPTSEWINEIAWSPAGRYLATWETQESSGATANLYLWDTTTWQIANTYTNMSDFSWSPDGSQMAMNRGGSVQIFATATNAVLHSFTSPNGWVGQVAWQPHGTSILLTTYNTSGGTYLSLWNPSTNASYTFTTYQGSEVNSGISWSSDGKYVLMSAFNQNPPQGSFYEVIWIAE